MFAKPWKKARGFGLVLVVGGLLAVAGCGGGGSECDKCSSDKDCDSGQSCKSTTLGDRCLKNGSDSCGVNITQL
jgi:hypothetical protein